MEHESTEPGPASAAPGDGIREPQAVAGQTGGIGRRQLLRAGVGAAPILMTLHSGPVSATTACTVASSFVSVATFASRSPGTTYIKCSYKNASTWRDTCYSMGDQSTWPAWAKLPVKTHLCNTTSTYSTWWVGSVMKTGTAVASSGQLAVLQRILGLSLTMDNASNQITTAGAPGGLLDKTYLAGVWLQYCNTGRYSVPADNVDWSETDLINWLNMLQYDVAVA